MPDFHHDPAFYDDLRAKIDAYGHTVLGVFSDGSAPSFGYTIGLSPRYGFELICHGLRPDYCQQIFNDIAANWLANGRELPLDVPVADFTNLPVVFKECNVVLAREYAVQAFQYYQQPVRVLQMVLCDRAGKFPWDAGFDHAYMDPRQRLLFNQEVLQ